MEWIPVLTEAESEIDDVERGSKVLRITHVAVSHGRDRYSAMSSTKDVILEYL